MKTKARRMTPAQRLAAHRAKVAKQEMAALFLLRLCLTVEAAAELDSLANLTATALGTGAITPGRAAGIRDVVRGIRKRLERKAVQSCPE